MRRRTNAKTPISLCLTLAFTAGQAAGLSTNEVVTITGDLLPDGLTTVSPFDAPALNDQGKVLYRASVAGPGTGTFGLIEDISGGPITALATNGDVPAGSATGLDLQFVFFQMNNLGLSAAGSTVTGTFTQVLLKMPPATTLAEVGDTLPSSTDTFNNIHGGNQGFALGDGGHLAFTSLIGTGGSSTSGMFRVNPDNSITELVRVGDATPSGDGTFDDFWRLGGQEIDGVSINASGEVAFRAKLAGTSLGNSDNTGIYKTDGTAITKIVRDRDPIPGGPSGQRFSDARFTPAFNDAGQAAFDIAVTGTGISSSNNEAIYVGDGTTLTEITQKGDAPPEGNGVIFDLYSPNLNSNGDVAFLADITGTSGGVADNRGIYVGDGVAIKKIAREGDTEPTGDGIFSSFAFLQHPLINDREQVAFIANLSGTTGGTSDSEAIYFYDPTEGLMEVVRKGDSLSGSTITDLQFRTNSFRNTPDSVGGLNDKGQLGYYFALADGRKGVAIWSYLLAGDTDGDGDIDDADLGAAFANYTGPLTPGTGSKTAADGDTDGDGDVDDADLGAAFAGYTGPLGPAPASVPEPASLAMLCLGALATSSRPRRARARRGAGSGL